IQVKQPFGDPDQLERVRISRKLVELKRDVPLPPLDDLVVEGWHLDDLHALFKELEFQVLVEKVKMRMPPSDDMVVVPAPEQTAVGAVETRNDARIVPGSGIAELVDDIRKAERMAITVELDPERAERAGIVAVVVALPGHPPAYVPIAHRYIG